jgi:TolB protein
MIKKSLCLAAPLLLALSTLFCGNAGTNMQTSVSTKENDSSIHPTSAIAYIRNGTEIRLIDSDGRNDRRIWTHPDIKPELGLYDLAWRPDGKELAFSSAHGALHSLYDADLYAIRPDGSGYRKITNTPDRKDFSRFKKGSVTLTVRNNQYSFQQAQSSAGVFFINIIGSDEPQMVTIAPGSSKTLVFKSVADFGARAQPLVATYGNYRWFMPGTDVVAGKNTKAPDLIISGDGIEHFGAYRPVWKQDGSQLSYRNGVCIIQKIKAQPVEADLSFQPLFVDKTPMGACTWDYGPTAALANQVIYTENSGDDGSGIFLMKEGDKHNPSRRLTLFSNIQYQLLYDLKWLPDGSGLLYATVDLFRESANIFRYDMKTKQTRQLTQLNGIFARRFCISPSGKWIVYERAKTAEEDKDVDLWMMKSDGSEERLLVKNGLCPSWSR